MINIDKELVEARAGLKDACDDREYQDPRPWELYIEALELLKNVDKATRDLIKIRDTLNGLFPSDQPSSSTLTQP